MKNQENPYDNLNNSPMFKLSLSSKELFHSNFLEYLSTVERKNHSAFESLVQQLVGIENYPWPENWMVLREYHNFDLCIVEGNPDNEEGEFQEEEDLQEETTNENRDSKQNEDIRDYRILFVIENKVKSIPYEEQLRRYTREAEEQNWRYFAREAKKELNNTKKVFKVENGPWYKQDDKCKWYSWDENVFCWEEIEGKPEGSFKLSGKTAFYDSYITRKMESQKIHFILLTLAEDFPGRPHDQDNKWTFDDIELFPPKDKMKAEKNGDDKKMIKRSWKIIHYKQYAGYLSGFIGEDIGDLNKLVIEDYIGFVKNLSSLTEKWSKEYKYQDNSEKNSNKFLYFSWVNENNENNKDNPRKKVFDEEFAFARKHRIHDLYQKIKYSYLCGFLYDKIKSLENEELTVFPSNQGGLFKTGQERKRKESKYICVNHTYLHGEPLLEINIHPAFNKVTGYEYCYAIQVQGGVYEHGFQVKKWDNNESKSITAAEVWKKKIPFPHANEWMRKPTTEDDKAEWKNNKKCFYPRILPIGNRSFELTPKKKGNKDIKPITYPGYNKYDMNDSTYLYQSRRIMSDATIEAIISQMIYDTKQVVKWIKDDELRRQSAGL